LQVRLPRQALDKVKIFGITLTMKKNETTPPLSAEQRAESDRQEFSHEYFKGMKLAALDCSGAGKTYVSEEPQAQPQPFSDYKTTTKAIQFNLKDKTHREAFVGLIDELHNQSVVFYLRQDGLTVLVEL
jgi:hypothetical protein